MQSAPNVEGFDYISYLNASLPNTENVFGKTAESNDLYVETVVNDKWLLSLVTTVDRIESSTQSFGGREPVVFYRATMSKDQVKENIDAHIKLVNEEIEASLGI